VPPLRSIQVYEDEIFCALEASGFH
jgi:hypothetical protein